MKKGRCKANGEGTIYSEDRKRGKYYKGTVVIGYDLETGKAIRVSKGSYRKRDVVEWVNLTLTKKSQGLLVPNSSMQLQQWFYVWLFEYRINDLKASTFERYEGIYRNYIKDTEIGTVALKELSTTTIQRYCNELFMKGVSISSIKVLINRLKTSLNAAVGIGYIYRNPCTYVVIPKIHEPEDKKICVFTREEQVHFLNQAKDHQHQMLFMLAFASGLRLGELLALEWDDIDFEVQLVNVRRSVSERSRIDRSGNKKWGFIVTSPKTTKSIRTVSIPSSVIEALNDYKNKMQSGYADKIIFQSLKGGYISTRNLTRSYQRLLEKEGIEYKNFHSIRHTYATRLFEAGVSVKVVQELLGHSNIATTMDIYTHVMPKGKHDAVEAINELFLLGE